MLQPKNQNTLRPGAPAMQYTEDYFVYPVNFANLLAGTVGTGNIQIQADSDFIWETATYAAFDPAFASVTKETLLAPLVNVQIIDSGSGRQLYSQALPVIGAFGVGELPYVLTQPRIFKARSNISFQVTNFAAAQAYNLTLLLHGKKVWGYGAQ